MQLRIRDRKVISSDYISFIFDKPDNFLFYPGQYISLILPITETEWRGNTRDFTIASSPTEDYLMITFKKGITRYKHYLESLTPGDTIEISHPAGTFTLDETEPAIFIAGGIGITPFRSMIKYVVDNNLSTPITLLYSHSGHQFPFQEEFNKWRKQINLTTHYIDTLHQSRLNHTSLPSFIPHYSSQDTPIFYLAGSSEMIKDIHNILEEKLTIDPINIRVDSFDGY